MLPKDHALNIQRSFYRFLYERVSANYYVNYSAAADEELEKRIKNRVENYWKWITLHWLRTGPGIFSISLVQINCNSIIANDPYGLELAKMRDEVQEELNMDSIALLDFNGNPEDPVATDNVLIPRFRGSRPLPKTVGDTVNTEAMDWNIYVWRESILP